MGRHPTIWDFKTGIRHRIPARISPWGSRGLNPNFFLTHFGPKNAQKSIFWEGFEFIRDPSQWIWGPRGPRGPKGPLGAPKGPKGALGAPGPLGPWGPKNSLINLMWGLRSASPLKGEAGGIWTSATCP